MTVRIAERTTASRLGSYEVLHKLAVGGMAELFLARSVGPENFEKLVVLKRILPSLADNDKFVRLFLDEARLAAGLDHPCIAHVYDLGRVDGGYFFTMEYVHGRDIRSVLNHSIADRKPWPIEHAVHVASAIAGALHYAHDSVGPNGQPLGIVHRDVSPSNIMVTYEGAVKLLDFGVAKMATSTTKTRTGSLKGKVSYMSPEQAKGAPIDRRSDIFSLGIVMWEMVTMKRLFKADNDLATLQLIINEKPGAPSQVRPDCPPELDRIIARALETDPKKRYQTAQELQLDIENLAREGRMNQSSIALAKHMNVLFERDIDAWKSARAAGVSFADHIIAWSVEADHTPATEFADGDGGEEADSPTNPRILTDEEKTEQTQLPVAAPPAEKKKKKKRIKDYAIPKEPSIVIEGGLASEPESELTEPREALATEPEAQPLIESREEAPAPARASVQTIAHAAAPMPPVVARAPDAAAPVAARVYEPTERVRVPAPLLDAPAREPIGAAAREPIGAEAREAAQVSAAMPEQRRRGRMPLVVGALAVVAATVVAVVLFTRGGTSTPASAPSEQPAPAAAAPVESEARTPESPQVATPGAAPAGSEAAHVGTEPAHVEPAHLAAEPAHVEPAHVEPAHAAPVRAQRPVVRAQPPVARVTPAPPKPHAMPKPEHADRPEHTDAPKPAPPKFDPNAALPPM